jgi:hypothetical protein
VKIRLEKRGAELRHVAPVCKQGDAAKHFGRRPGPRQQRKYRCPDEPAANAASERIRRNRYRGNVIWTSPLIPLDPIVWRKDLDPAVKTKLYTFLLSYGRIGSDAEIKAAKAILGDLVWSTFQPSSDNQLIPIRVLEANKSLMKIQGDDKLSADEKSSQIAAIRADIAKLEEMQKRGAGRSKLDGKSSLLSAP